MREIKFRAWDKSKNKMCNVDFIKFSKVQYTQITFSNIEENKIIYHDSSLLDENMFGTCVLMQYIGLKDIKGVDIYEGDILKAICINKVGYEEVTKNNKIQYWTVEHKISNGYMGFMFYGTNRRWNTMISKNIINNCNCEIVGNIYENKELLDDNK